MTPGGARRFCIDARSLGWWTVASSASFSEESSISLESPPWEDAASCLRAVWTTVPSRGRGAVERREGWTRFATRVVKVTMGDGVIQLSCRVSRLLLEAEGPALVEVEVAVSAVFLCLLLLGTIGFLGGVGEPTA